MVAVQTVGRAVLVASLTAVCGCQTATEQRLQALLAECNSGNQASCAAVPMYQHQEALEAGERRTRAAMMLGAAAVIQAASQPRYYPMPYIAPSPSPVVVEAPSDTVRCMTTPLGSGYTQTNCR